MEKIPIKQVILCEGKYDVIRLSALFDTLVLPTHGFQIYSDAQRRALFQRLAAQRGVVIATDSDAAGFKIRAYLKSFLPAGQIWHVVVPDVKGREKRKDSPSKEGKLGVEGMDTRALLEAFAPVTKRQEAGDRAAGITRMDLYRDGFSGTPGCQERYHALLRALGLPERLTANVFCACVGAEEYQAAKGELGV